MKDFALNQRSVELCLASTHFYPARGGATLRFLRYVPGLQQRGINIRILTGTPKAKKGLTLNAADPWQSLPDDAVLPAAALSGVPVERLRLPPKAGWLRSLIFSQAMLNFCRQPGYKPDVLTVVSSLQPRSLPWIIRVQKLGIKVVYAYTLATEFPSHPLKRIIRKWTLRQLYRRLDCMVVGSDVMRDLALAAGANTRLVVIPNGVDLQRFRPAWDLEERNKLRAVIGLDDNHTMITSIGAVHPRKGADVLVEAWALLAKRFPEVHLFLVGLRKDLRYPDLNEFHQKIKGLITASGAADRVHFPGLVGNVEAYLRASDVFVFPSAREGMPNAVLEAMASGLPVILTPFKGLSDDLGCPGREYLLADRQPAALAATITDVLENQELSADLKKHARRWVEQTMDLERVLDRYAALYRELARQVPQ